MDPTTPHPMVGVPEALRTVLRVAARQWVQQQQTANDGTVELPVTDDDELLLGQCLAEAVVMPAPGYPPYAASIMDGYAIRTQDFSSKTTTEPTQAKDEGDAQRQQQPTHVIVDKVYAGDENKNSSKAKEMQQNVGDGGLFPAVYVTTGAKIPESFDCVIPIEECQVVTTTVGDEQQQQQQSLLSIRDSAKVAPNQWIRPPGCDLPPDSTVLAAGHVLDPVSLGLLRQVACQTVTVRRRVMVGVVSTGNELVPESWDLVKHGREAGHIPDVNRPVLRALLSSWNGCEVRDYGTCRDDDIPSLVARLQQAVTECDAIVTTGGISMGETDVLERVLVQHLGGTVHFGRLHMKPGKPSTFVTVPRGDTANESNPNCLVFALPGNPVSAVVCSHLLVQPCLRLLYRGPDVDDESPSVLEGHQLDHIVDKAVVHAEVRARLTQTLKLDFDRPEYHRVSLTMQQTSDGGSITFLATSTGTQRSSRLASVRDADGLAVLPQATDAQTHVHVGDEVLVLLLHPPPFLTRPATTVATSQHLKLVPKGKPPLQLAVVRLGSGTSDDETKAAKLAEKAQHALTGAKSGAVTVRHAQSVSCESVKEWTDLLSQVAQQAASADLILLITAVEDLPRAFERHSQWAQELRQRLLVRVSPALAQQLRSGAASGDPTAALWEVVVGFFVSSKARTTTLVVLLSDVGLAAGLGHVRGLLKHALQMARGRR